jgi:hypothetical protein
MSLPVLQQSEGQPGASRREDKQRILRRVKDSKEQLKSRTRARGESNGTIDTITSNSTAGRSYTVANVHHGVIYLRPTARGRVQPEAFVFPHTPDSALDGHLHLHPASTEWAQSLSGSRTPRSEAKAGAEEAEDDASRPLGHARSHSFSTVDEPGTFKILIRPQTADTSGFPLLQVPIPTYKLVRNVHVRTA